jgi:hypothetical protein
MLLEERDRHIKDRLYRVVKIETFARLLNDLQAEGEIDAQTLSQIISEKTKQINEAGNEIWLNLITREKDTPLFYKLGMIDVEKIDNNDVYLTLDDQPSDEFILKQNIDALIQSKNATIQRIAHELISIPAPLVRLKVAKSPGNLCFQVKEEIYGATSTLSWRSALNCWKK